MNNYYMGFRLAGPRRMLQTFRRELQFAAAPCEVKIQTLLYPSLLGWKLRLLVTGDKSHVKRFEERVTSLASRV